MAMTKESSEYFKQVAGQWDDLRTGFFTEVVRETAIAKAYLRPEMAVADVGSGTGFIASGLAPLVQKVHVIDGSAGMLDVARKNLAPFTNIEYHQADGQSIPLPDSSLDAVFANMYLHHVVDPLAALSEMVRIMKPGGRLVITDLDAHPYTWLKEEMADVWMGFDRDALRTWYRNVDLVNVILDGTGQACSTESKNANITDAQGRSATIGIFVATGTRRVRMQNAVKEAYSATAQAASPVSASCCGGSTGAVAVEPTPAASQPASCCSSESCACTSGQDVSFTTNYSPEERASIPTEAQEISLGCGNPIAMANLRPGEVALDIGSGGGMDSFLAASRVAPGGRVIGVDMTPAMLERARATAVKNGIANVEFRQGQAERLPALDGSVDVVLSNCVINLCEDKGQVFQEAYRVLRAGGRLEVSDVVTSGAFPLDARQNAGDWAGCISGALPEKEYLDLIAQAGFANVTVRRSNASGEVNGVQVYSAIVSAQKTGIQEGAAKTASCGCGSSCC